MLKCSLSWTLLRRPLCPACLEELTDASFVFRDNLAFCPLCAHAHRDVMRDECVRLFYATIAPNHIAIFRRLVFFTPHRTPRKPIQLVRVGDADDWLLR